MKKSSTIVAKPKPKSKKKSSVGNKPEKFSFAESIQRMQQRKLDPAYLEE